MAKVRELTSRDLEGLYLLREGLEAITTRLTAQRINDNHAGELIELAKVYEENWATETGADVVIHQHIVHCADVRCSAMNWTA